MASNSAENGAAVKAVSPPILLNSGGKEQKEPCGFKHTYENIRKALQPQKTGRSYKTDWQFNITMATHRENSD